MSLPSDTAGSIQGQLLRWLFSVFALLLVVGAAIDYIDDSLLIQATFDRTLGGDVVAVAAQARMRADIDLDKQVRALLRAKREDDDTYYLIVWGEGQDAIGDRTLPVADAGGDESIVYQDARYRDRAIRVASYRSKAADAPRLIAIAETLNARHRTILEAFLRDTAINVLMFVLTSATAWFCVRHGLCSLRRLRDKVLSRPAGDLSALPETQAPSEVRPLVAALNQLVARTLATTHSQQQFVADAAHQLRTPLAGLQTQLEVMLRAAGTDDVLQSRLRSAHESVRRLGRTANQLLALARTEASLPSAEEFTLIDLPALIESCVERALSRAMMRGLDLGADRSPARIRGVAWQLGEMLSNLIDNAISYTPAGGRITVGCGLDATRCAFLYVTDDGPGIPVEERERACDRFYRVRGTAGTGSGLGLAVVLDVARLHGAALSIGDGENGRGTRVTIRFLEPPAELSMSRGTTEVI